MTTPTQVADLLDRAADHIDRVGPPEEIFTRDYIAKLYHMEPGRYDPCFSTLDLVP